MAQVELIAQPLRRLADLHPVWINSNLHTMRMGNRRARTWIAIAVALVFVLAAMPGTMAMPVSHASPAMAAMADCCGQQSDHMNGEKQPNKPCKDMAVCFGLLSCYGLAALPIVATPVIKTAQGGSRPTAPKVHSGLTVPPDDPPPIA